MVSRTQSIILISISLALVAGAAFGLRRSIVTESPDYLDWGGGLVIAVVVSSILLSIAFNVANKLNFITGLVALAFVGTFTIGLTHSISKGSAGFSGWGGGVVIAIIVGVVLLCAAYDVFDTAIRKKK